MKFDFLTMSLRHGLFHQEQDGISCFLPGSAISVCFQGREITVEIEDMSINGKSWINAYIDDLPVRVFRIDPENKIYQLADDLDDTPHTLTLQKRTEAGFGTIKFVNLTAENGHFTTPPSPLPHQIMVIGDSITCGYGNEAHIPCDCDASRENNALAYSSLIGQFLNSETLIVGASGTGCYQNFGGFKEGRMSDYFMNIICPDLDQKAMDKFLPEVIVINLGTNDWSAPIDPTDYTNRYHEMIDFIRLRYPSAELFCVIGPMTDGPSKHLEALVKTVNEAGDTHVHFMEFPLIKRPEDGMGGSGHPSIKKHRQMAVQLSEKICQVCKDFTLTIS
ncbi:MAG: lipolytic protein family [Herbinix sp.]|jgi:lysophospholipase L1-like esterase|nr:lipolytic protein family [Herbinix sp.]